MTCQIIGWCALSSAEQAAWAQALLSGIGLILAALMPLYLARWRRRTEINRIVEIFRITKLHADKTAEIRHQFGNEEIVKAQVNLWDGLRTALAEIPAHTTPDAELFQHIVIGRNAASRIYRAILDISTVGYTPTQEGEIMVSRKVIHSINEDLSKYR